jgi:transporter family protein
MISSAMVVTTSTTITILRGDIKAFSRDNLASPDGMLALGAGVALVTAVVFYFLALSEGPTSVVVPIYGMFIVGGAVLGLFFCSRPAGAGLKQEVCFYNSGALNVSPWLRSPVS